MPELKFALIFGFVIYQVKRVCLEQKKLLSLLSVTTLSNEKLLYYISVTFYELVVQFVTAYY